MKFELKSWKKFKDTILASELMLDEIKFEADSDGLRFRGLDKSHVAFMNLDIKKEYFDTYEIDLPETCIIDVGELVKVLKRIKSNDVLRFIFSEDDLIIQFDGEALRTFKIRMIDMVYDAPMLPNLNYECEVDVDLKELRESIKDCELYDDRVKISTDEQNVHITAEGGLGDYQSIIPVDTKLESVESVFSLEWLKRFFKIGDISDIVTLKMGNTKPILLNFEDDELIVMFLLAPRIEEE